MPRHALYCLLALAALGTLSCGGVGVSVCGGWWCVGWYPPPPPCASCSYPTAVAVSDFDRDGHLDVATVARGAQGVGVLFGDGRGGVRDGLLVQQSTGPSADFVEAGRFDADPYVDLALIDAERGVVRILRGDGSGNFGAAGDPSATETTGRIVAAFAGRADADDLDDLVVLDDAGQVVVLVSDAVGRVSARRSVEPTVIGLGASDLAIGHVDADATLDAVVLDRSSDTVVVLLGDGLGGFVAAGERLATGPLPTALTGGELDGLPGMDVAVADGVDGTVRVYLSNADGTYTASPEGPLALPTPNGVRIRAVGDPAQPDGPADLAAVVADETTALLLVGFPNAGDGSFGPHGRPIPLGSVRRLAVGDLDGDGRSDLVVANPNRRAVGLALAGTRED